MITALLLYLAAILLDGDYLNDYLTHLPATLQPIVLFFGHLLAIITGA